MQQTDPRIVLYVKTERMKGQTDIGKIYDDYSVRLYNIGLRIVGDASDAEEIMHDTLLKYLSYGRKDEIRDLAGWLAQTCIRKAIDRLREKHRYKDFLTRFVEMDTGEMTVQEEPDVISVESIKKALTGLPDHYRVVLTLHLLEGYDYQEISQITGTKESTIRTLYMRGRQKLAEALRR